MTLIYFLVFALGMIIGSFLNCIIYRLHTEESFIKGRSFCPNCKKGLKAIDLIPLFSFLSLRGKCRYCSTKISFQYPLVEVITGALFVLTLHYKMPHLLNLWGAIEIGYLFLIISLMVVIFVYDLKHYLIPDEAVFMAIGATFLWQLLSYFNGAITLNEFGLVVLSGLGASSFFLSLFLVSKGSWIGFGDVKLAIFMGFFLGLPNILVALFLSFMIGAIIGVGLVLSKKKELKSEVPFAPFLIIGTLLAFFVGESLTTGYINLFY